MQEIYPDIFIETRYAGVTLGAINRQHGLVLIDAPFLPEETRAWRSALLNLGGGVDRLLINLDAHIDRILGSRAMECTIVGHDDLAQIFQTRPFAYRSQSFETGAEWEMEDSLGSIRWAPPEITFTEEMIIHWDEHPVVLERCKGAEIGALWVRLPHERVLFLGDLVTPEQPPFLANVNIPLWVETLKKLLEPKFADHVMIGGRNGLVRREHVSKQIRLLELVKSRMDQLADRHASENETETLISALLQEYEIPSKREELYRRRLKWGLSLYYLKNYFPEKFKETEV